MASRSVSRKMDFLGMIEAAYVVDGSTGAWTARLLDAVDGALASEFGGFACGIHLDADGSVSIDRTSAASKQQPPEILTTIFDGLTSTPQAWLAPYARNPRSAAFCVMTSEVDPNRDLRYRSRLAKRGVRDGINLIGLDLDRGGFLVSLGVGGRRVFAPAVRRSLVKVATHILAARRLRGRLGVHAGQGDQPPSSMARAEAILSTEGKVLHAQGQAELASARRALQAAARDVERARTSLRGEVDRALGLWKGLVSARWTLIDQFDAQGARYIVARENLPVSGPLAKLTATERCVLAYATRGFSTKEIAYTLGVAPATVRVLIMRAARRYGARNRDELFNLDVAARLSPAEPAARDRSGQQQGATGRVPHDPS